MIRNLTSPNKIVVRMERESEASTMTLHIAENKPADIKVYNTRAKWFITRLGLKILDQDYNNFNRYKFVNLSVLQLN